MGKYAAGELKPPSTGMCFLQVEFFFLCLQAVLLDINIKWYNVVSSFTFKIFLCGFLHNKYFD